MVLLTQQSIRCKWLVPGAGAQYEDCASHASTNAGDAKVCVFLELAFDAGARIVLAQAWTPAS
jgi:hypothetical protein